jgi:hypothetical protein
MESDMPSALKSRPTRGLASQALKKVSSASGFLITLKRYKIKHVAANAAVLKISAALEAHLSPTNHVAAAPNNKIISIKDTFISMDYFIRNKLPIIAHMPSTNTRR